MESGGFAPLLPGVSFFPGRACQRCNIANLMPTLSYCKSVNNCSPNLLLFKVDRYEKLYFDPFFTCRAFWPCPTQLLIYISQCPSCPALLLPTLWSTFALPLWSVPLPWPVLHCFTLPCALSAPALQTLQFLAEATVRFCDWYIYIYIYI